MADGGSVIFKFEGDTKDLDKATGKAETSLGALAKSFTIAEIASTAFNKAIQLINENLDASISRFDTMNNFPRVMENLGFNADDASKAVETLSDGLLGLPTALDDSISYVQRFTAKNDDLEKSSQIFLAINDAILAGGGNAQTQASAIEQFAQSFSKGKPDLMEWRTLLTAMPGQLKQVAISMGYASADDLYEAFKSNRISMNDFTDAIIRLDKEGINGMASFNEQAKSATQGIGTSLKNLKTRTVRAITDVISKINDGLESYGGISGVIESLSKVITKVISKVGDIIGKVIKMIPKIIAGIKPLLPIIEGILAAFIAYKVITGIITGISAAMKILNTIMAMNPYILLATAIVGVTTATVALVKAINTGTEAEKEQAEAMKENTKQIKENEKAYNDLTEAQNKKVTEGLSELQHTQELANELKKLADEQGNVAEKDRARAEFILGELNNALGTEYQMIDGQIQKYNELSASIDEQIEKKRMQILFEAREEEYRNALSKWTDLQRQKEEQRLKVQKAIEDFNESSSKANRDRMTEAIEGYDSLARQVEQASTDIISYEDAVTANLSGNTEEAKNLLMNKGRSFIQLKDIANQSQEEQTRVLKNQLDRSKQYLADYQQKYHDSVAGYTADGLQQAIEYARRAEQEYQNVGKNINRGIQQGLNSNSGAVTSTMGSIAQSMLNKIRNTLGIHSPSKVFEDVIGKNIALGIGVGFENEMNKVSYNMDKIVSNLLPEMSDIFSLSPTLNNTATANTNVNIKVINNMETDMMGNLINNIKTFSNGSKNDYNYGMS